MKKIVIIFLCLIGFNFLFCQNKTNSIDNSSLIGFWVLQSNYDWNESNEIILKKGKYQHYEIGLNFIFKNNNDLEVWPNNGCIYGISNAKVENYEWNFHENEILIIQNEENQIKKYRIIVINKTKIEFVKID